jgi:hypothetical protein
MLIHKERRAKFFGGPMDGDEREFLDTDQRLAMFPNALGEVVIYVREGERPGESFVRFIFGDILDAQGRSVANEIQNPMRPQGPSEIQNPDEEPDVIRQRVEVRLNSRSHEWELVILGQVMETTSEKNINGPDDAANWLRELGVGQ